MPASTSARSLSVAAISMILCRLFEQPVITHRQTSPMPPTKTPGTTKGPTKGPKRKPTSSTGGISKRTLLIALGGAAVVAIALIGGSLLLGGGDDDPSTTTPTGSTELVDGIPQQGTTLGKADATVTLIQWEDFQCPACGAYQEGAFPGIVEQYVRPGKINVDFRGLTFLDNSFGVEDSERALRAALAAGKQGKFWQMQELLYQNQGEEGSGWVTDDLIDELATKIGLDMEQFAADKDSAAVTDQIAAMKKEGEAKGVQGTPTFFISVDGGEPYQVQPDEYSVEAFAPIFDDALQG